MATPMIRALRRTFPRAQIDMVVRADFLDVIRNNPHLDQKLAFPRKAGFSGLVTLVKTINRERYDLIYDAHRSLRTFFLMPFLKADKKVYLKKYYFRRNLALIFKFPFSLGQMIDRYISPLKLLGIHPDGGGPEVFIDDAERQKAKAIVKGPPATWIGVVPSAQWPGKRWATANYRKLLSLLISQTPFSVILFGGPSDSFCSSLSDGLPSHRVINTQGKLTIAEATAAIDECAFVVANDTGLMHIADALKKPTVLILGPTSKELGCLPTHPLSQVLEHDLWCRPCSKNGQAPCIRLKRHCLELTTPAQVFEMCLRVANILKLEFAG